MTTPVYIIDGARTPFLKARNAPGPFAASDLATAAGSALLMRQPFAPDQLDEVILGCASPSPDEVNIGRVVALRMGCGVKVPGWTVMRNCASGMQALDSAIANLQTGRSQLVLAGGVDALSRAPLLFSDAMVRWLSGWYAAKKFGQKLAHMRHFRLGHLAPVIGIMKGLTDPVVGQLMGQTAENLAWRFGITRDDMDAFAVESHRRVAAAQDAGHFAEIVPLIDRDGTLYTADDGLRRDASTSGLAKLKPFFDKHYGRVTAGNSSQITDGATWLLLASEAAVVRHGLTPLGRIADSQWAGLAPEQMGLGPVHAATPILQRHGLGLHDVDLWEINEAFAAQVIACRRAWQDTGYCREQLGLDGALGALDVARLNVDGGAVALGHPVGASGARIVLHLLHSLRRTGGRRGVAAICIGGGQGGAMLVEAL
ncbi:MAG TPA: acetyl-CoA C-acetyltransferase [Zoogloea sp.]|uniref:acetyl-CoA C-acetyltransferase n=1 Tax=Zoogloea sp. TaxID=49181 RepID=UPI002D12F49F|nr:acetyl-CoA C-acetyltransferase [Zoogloea sp.]HMV16751.1 acetyl-CoA C-acetyltransferase [Rhodocyclaceae bacterium]HMW51041.1 acetyl-CoA C-acetyltransferase [Rhodocyclaceae bacterium]HMZ75315.1 acetyl-CoA C-acetyltransferase [Rhodocyclaceae bacterium]HNB63596.1 acetyl-CoA C-acetyltransferase [Rhodocyclaceae bacterium]HNC78323.1 acetyl-CoA C-acetyltransferase [Rhodocyclaceae bacterium]